MMDAIMVDNPRARQCHAEFDYLIEHASGAQNKPKRCVAVIAPSQTGKTTIIDTFVEQLNTPELLNDGMIPALKVTLGTNLTPRRFAQDILRTFETFGYETIWQTGTEAQLLHRLSECIKTRRVKAIFLDEFHHLVHSDNCKVIQSVSETVKTLLIEGACPLVVAGLEDARKPFDANPQLAHRAQRHIELKPLDPFCHEDRKLFFEFLAEYSVLTEKVGACGNLDWILEDANPASLVEASGGVLGATCNLLKDAVQIAAREDRFDVSLDDLTRAVDVAVNQKLCPRNPFRDGLKPITRSEAAFA